MPQETENLTVGILGLGTFGSYHADFLADMGHNIVGADADPALRDRFTSKFDAQVYESPDELYTADLDAAIITTPNKFHEATATRAFEEGLDVLLEKPLADSIESAQRIVDTAEETGSLCMVGFHHRFRDIVSVTKNYIDTGYLGEITHIDAKFVRRRGIPGRGTWYTSGEIAGGGALIDVGAHVIDLVLYFLDWPEIDDVMANARSDFRHGEEYAYLEMWAEDDHGKMYNVEDSVTGYIEFDNGSTVSIEVAWAENATREHTYRVLGTDAGAQLDITNRPEALDPVLTGPDVTNELTLYEVRKGGADHFVNSEVITNRNNPYRTELQTFVDAVQTGTPPDRGNLSQALAVQRVIHRLYDECEDNG